MIWLLIAVLTVGTLILKIAGPVLVGGTQLPAPLIRVIALLTPVLLGALVVTSLFADGQRITLDASAAGFAAGAVLLLCRAPLLVALVVAAALTAIIRLAL